MVQLRLHLLTQAQVSRAETMLCYQPATSEPVVFSIVVMSRDKSGNSIYGSIRTVMSAWNPWLYVRTYKSVPTYVRLSSQQRSPQNSIGPVSQPPKTSESDPFSVSERADPAHVRAERSA